MSTIIQICLAVAVVVLVKRVLFGNRKDTVPHVGSWLPLVGHNLKLRYHARTFLAECRAKYGTAYSIGYLGKKLYILADDEARFMVKHCDQNMFGARNEVFRSKFSANVRSTFLLIRLESGPMPLGSLLSRIMATKQSRTTSIPSCAGCFPKPSSG
ncbi:hypothetical protein DSO57_1000559 [Entomophthora muscae]|uniref:Uncharacterized protein n=1 Tax=Entomophthora muscae TaxID=34485 RepID=A0ACC2SB28_9FUNG|nr:hypothetical protein DSO57_1000559 [Entomophthora muscae]